jgi:hypothetical protein
MIGGFGKHSALSCHPARLKFSCLSENAMQAVRGNEGIEDVRNIPLSGESCTAAGNRQGNSGHRILGKRVRVSPITDIPDIEQSELG